MPAYFDCGFSVREPMWHGEGLVLTDYPDDWDRARTLAGLDWEPEPAPVFVAEGRSAIGNREVAGFQAIRRSDTGEVLGLPTGAYSVITHAQMGEIIEAVLAADSNVKFETAGSCRGGRQVWALAYLDEPYQLPGDTSQTYPFLALLNSHDGTAACSLTYTDVRVVCWNTWNAADAQGEQSGTRFVFRHTGDVTDRIAQAKQALSSLREDSKRTHELFLQLAQVPVNDENVVAFTERFLPSPRDTGEQCTDRVHNNVVRARGAFGRLYLESPTMDGIQGTAYGLLQASTEYLDHIRKAKSKDTLMGRTLLKPEGLKTRALGLIKEVVGA